MCRAVLLGADPRGSLGNMTAVAGVREGDILAGKYRVEKILGQGAMGVVVAARHLKLDERVAIKFLLPETLANPEAVARFAREARAAVKIKSEHIARVGDVGTLDNGAPFMVMEYLEGGDLAAWLEERGPLSIEQTVEFVLQALEAMAEAHALGIIHRDLKPANLFWVRRADGLLSIKVLDFGISKIGGAAGTAFDMAMTRHTDVMGSPLYMSPEQMRSARDVDATTDIWAVGVILFELLTGQAPFVADNMPELVLKIAGSAPEPLRSVMPAAPAQLERVILRCLEKDRANRYRNVAELAADLADFGPKRARASAERIGRIIQASGLSEEEFTSPPSSNRDATRRTSPARITGRWTLVGLAIALVAVVAVVLLDYLATSAIPEASVSTATPSVTAFATAAPLPVRGAEERSSETSAAASSGARALPAIEHPATGAVEKRPPPPAKKVPMAPNTVGAPNRIPATSPPAAFSAAHPGAMPSSAQPATPRADKAYIDRK